MNIGGMELFVIIAIVLLLFGPSQIPKLAKGMGQAMREFKKAQREINDEIVRDDAKDTSKTPDNKSSN